MKFWILFFIPYLAHALSIHDAVHRLDNDALSIALASCKDVDELRQGKTALILAVQTGDQAMVSKLLDASANPNIGSPSPLVLALEADQAEIAALLLDHGADLPKGLGISDEGLIYDLLLKRRYKSVELLVDRRVAFRKEGKMNPFSLALSFAPISLIQAFIDNDADINYRDPYLDRPLEIALRLGRSDVVSLLIDSSVDIEDSHFLEIAVSHEDLLSLKKLVKAGCLIDRKRQNLLMLAVKYGSVEMLHELARAGASLNYATKDSKTALTEAIKHKQDAIFSWLMEHELDPAIHHQAIFYAIKGGNLAFVQQLVAKGIGLQSLHSSGLTPLLYANHNKQFEIAHYLIEQDIDLEGMDAMGETALFQSIRFFQDTMMQLLLAKQVDIAKENRKGLSAIDLSIAVGNFSAFKKLLARNVTVSKEALILSVQKGLERFYVMLQEKFDIKQVVDDKANTLLHTAAAYDRTSLLKRLILQGLDLEAINHRGETALHVAAKEGFKRSCSLLLSFDADIKAVDMKELQPRHLALKYNHVKLSKWLENYQIKLEEKALMEHNQTLDANATKENNATVVSKI